MHGANRLGGNGVANSTVFGGIAGDAMAACVAREGAWREPDAQRSTRAIARADRRFALRRPVNSKPFASASTRRCGTTPDRARRGGPCARDGGARRTRCGARRLRAAARRARPRLQSRAGTTADRIWTISFAWSRRDRRRGGARRARTRAAAHFRADFPGPAISDRSYYTRVVQQDFALSVHAGAGSLHADPSAGIVLSR